jgi:hypothetical protein
LWRRASVTLCVALAALELVHPATFDDQPAWVPLHIALLALYLVLGATLWSRRSQVPFRVALIAFCVANTAFLAIDGVFAPADLNATLPTILADVTGAAWSLTLLALAAPPVWLGAAVWLAFMSNVPLLSHGVAIAAVAWLAYRGGASAIPAALLVFAAALRQHVGPEAALGLVLLAVALGWPAPARAGSNPAAASRPEAASPR